MQERYRPFLKDLMSRTKIDLDAFLYCIFNRKKGDSIFTIIHELVKNKKLGDEFTIYQNVKRNESEQYTPFANLVNLALETMRKPIKKIGQSPGLDVVFRLHDGMIVSGSKASRKPDGVILNRSNVNSEFNTVSRQSWTKILAFVEHKTLKDETALKNLKPVSGTKITKASTSMAALRKLGSGSEDKGPKGLMTTMKSHASSRNSKGTDSPVSPSPMTQSRSSSRIKSEEAQSTQSNELWQSLERSLHLGRETASTPTKPPSQPPESENGQLGPPDDAPTYEEQLIQCASYALELLSNGLVRNHALGFLVSNTRIESFYYDRSSIVSCAPFDLVKEREKFLQLILCLTLLSQAEWGIAEWFQHSEDSVPQTVGKVSSDKFNGSAIELQNGDKLVIQYTLYRQHGLIGRGTHVYRAEWSTASGQKKGNVFVKFSWSPETRTAEKVFVSKAREYAENDDPSMLNHLPNILYSEEAQPDSIQLRLKEVLGDKYELRVKRLTIHDELLPITQLKTAGDLLKAMRDIFKCYRWLYEKAKIMHRDISLNNLMFRMKDGKIYGVLNDLDLATTLDSTEVSSKQRTGTKPFLAIDLLEDNPPRHMYQHDLESFFYVFVWITFRYHNGVEKNTSFQNWALEDHEHPKSAKVQFISTEVLGRPTANYAKLHGLLMDMQDAIRLGLQARRTFLGKAARGRLRPFETFDEDTLGGNVSFDAFQDILDIDL